jgi:hypothetical protein
VSFVALIIAIIIIIVLIIKRKNNEKPREYSVEEKMAELEGKVEMGLSAPERKKKKK